MAVEEWQFNVTFLTSAFTPAEIGKMLPIGIDDESRNFRIVFSRTTHWWYAGYENVVGSWPYHSKSKSHLFAKGKTEADARAKMLIYLLESALI